MSQIIDKKRMLLQMSEDSDDDSVLDTNSTKSIVAWIDIITIIVALLLTKTPLSRSPTTNCQKLVWKKFISRYGKDDKFIKRHLRMSLQSFYKLLSYIKKDLIVSEYFSEKRGGSVLPEICLFCTLRWLAGGSYLDIYVITGVSIPSFYRVVYKTLQLICDCKELDLHFPLSQTDCIKAAKGFENISYKSAIINCIGCIDGYLLRIYTPQKSEAKNVKSFFSGHYQCHGINIQAVCDSKCRFTYFAIAAPGSTNDRDAIKETNFYKLMTRIPVGYCVIGDAAYEASERLVSMYCGLNRQSKVNDSFNFYASQCRIRIEMAFGLMQMKFGILWRPLKIKLKNVKFVILAISRLHNFIINERLADACNDDEEDELLLKCNKTNYYQTDIRHDNGDALNNIQGVGVDVDNLLTKGISNIRDHMTMRVAALGLHRPKSNIIKNDNEFL